jgi:hypothetical protein
MLLETSVSIYLVFQGLLGTVALNGFGLKLALSLPEHGEHSFTGWRPFTALTRTTKCTSGCYIIYSSTLSMKTVKSSDGNGTHILSQV